MGIIPHVIIVGIGLYVAMILVQEKHVITLGNARRHNMKLTIGEYIALIAEIQGVEL